MWGYGTLAVFRALPIRALCQICQSERVIQIVSATYVDREQRRESEAHKGVIGGDNKGRWGDHFCETEMNMYRDRLYIRNERVLYRTCQR